MRNSYLVLLITLFAGAALSAQVKIGDNPQNIDPSSVLELESTDKVLVITRVTTAQMNAIVPSEGALCFNTDLQSVHYYNGTLWVNVGGGGGTGGPLTADPIVNPQATIVITPTATGDNLEVAPNSIRSEQIVDGGVNGVDIQDGSIGPGKLQDFSITQEKLSENSVGAFALDNDSFGVSAFNNDAGYITAGDIDIVSPDANNVLEDRPNGVFYNDQFLIDAVNQNTDAIALDNDQSATNEIQTLSIVGNEITISDSNTITLPAGAVADGSETIVTAGTNVTVTGTGTMATPYVINSTAVGGSTEVIDGQTLIGVGTVADPFEIAPSPTPGQFLQTDTAGDVVWVNLPPATGGGVETDGLTIVNDGSSVANQLMVPAGGISSTEIANSTILGEDLNQMTATDGQVLTWDDDANGVGIGGWLPATAGSGGNQNLGQVLTEGNDGGGALIKNILDPVDAQDAATRAYVDAAVTSGGGLTDGTILIGGTGDTAQQLAVSGDATLANDGALTIANDAVTTAKIENATILAEDLNDMGATDGQILIWDEDANGAGMGEWVPSPAGSAVSNEQDITLNSTTNTIDLLEDDGTTISSSVQLDGTTIEAFDNGTNGDTSDDFIRIKPADALDPVADQMLITSAAGDVEWAPLTSHTGTAKSIFFADTDGTPTTADDNTNVDDDRNLYWDTAGRPLGSQTFGALFVGLQGTDKQSENVKMQIADNFPSGIGYALQVQNYSGSPTGILFSTDTDNEMVNYGKGALIYQNTGAGNARGDFHFLQNDVADTSVPTLADIAFTVNNNKDIVLYNGIDINGIGKGTAGQVLASTGNMAGDNVEWVDALVDFNDTDTNDGLEYGSTAGYNVNVDNSTIEIDGDALRIKPLTPAPATNQVLITNTSGDVAWADAGGDNLASTNLTQLATDPVRTFNIATTTQSLQFTGLGRVGIGNFGVGTAPPAPENKFHVLGAIRSEGFLNSDGTAGTPSYRFSNDTDTGMYSLVADQIGFSVGGFEALRIDEPTAGNTNVIVNESLELDGQLIDISNTAGTDGQVLTSTTVATVRGVAWVNPSVRAMGKVDLLATAENASGASVARNSIGNYTVTLTNAIPASDYIIQLTLQNAGANVSIEVVNQNGTDFDVLISETSIDNSVPATPVLASTPVDSEWFFTVLDF